MEFRDLKRQYRALQTEIDAGMREVIRNTDFISGKKVSELEEKLASDTGVKHVISCANGTDALSLALMAWGIGPGDAVFVPDFTFFASGEAVALQGAAPVFVDVREDTFNLDPDKLKKAVENVFRGKKWIPKAILAVDLFGQPAEYEALRKVADEYGLLLLEDGAQGFGGRIHGKKACSFGDIATTSFFPAKPLGCYGDGGAVFTNSDTWAELIRSYCIHGKGRYKYDNVRIGINSRLDTMQAAVLLAKYDAFQSYELEQVNRIADRYAQLLPECVKIPVIREGYRSSWAQYTIQLSNEQERNSLQEYLKCHGVPGMVYYPKPMHRQKAFEPYDMDEQDLTVTEELCKKVLSLPMHPYLEDDEIMQIAELIREWAG